MTGATREEGHQGTDPISRLPSPFCSNKSFLNSPSSSLRKETQLNKYGPHQAIRLLRDKTKQYCFMRAMLRSGFLRNRAQSSPSHVCFLCVIIAGEGGQSKWFSAWSLIQDSALLGSPSCWEAEGWQENLLAGCLRLFVLTLNPLYTSSHANTSNNQQLWDTGGFV